MSAQAPRTVLVTGGTGLVGSAIVDAMPDMRVISLTRHGSAGWVSRLPQSGASASSLLPGLHGHIVPSADERDNVVQASGDVTEPQLGLDDAAYEAMATEVDLVLHVAGVSDFTMPKGATDSLNIEGARHVLAFAERAGVPLHHVSTGYVKADGTTVNGRWGAGVYIDSKRRAEDLLEGSGALEAIIRPSIVFSDSRTGWSPSFQGLHRVIGMMLEDKIPLLPFGPDVRVDFLPRDVVGSATAEVVRRRHRGEFWLTAGSSALSFGRIVELLIEYGTTLGLEPHPPRFVSQDMIDRLLKPAGGAGVARRIDLLVALTSHFSSSPELRSDLADAEKGDLEDAFMKGARYWAEQQGVGAASHEALT